MASMTSWFAVGSAALAVGLLVDNIRLRGELDSVQAKATVTDGQVKRVTKGKRRSSTSVAAGALTRNEATDVEADDARQEVMEARIEREVSERVEVAVEARIDQDLDELVEERVEARMAERHEKRRERHRAAMEEHVSEYVEEKGHTEETQTQMMSAIEVGMSSLGDVFRAMRDEDIDRETARDEMGAIRDELDVALTEILGEAEAEEFQENLRGPLGRSWRRR